MGQARRSSEERKRIPGGDLSVRRAISWLLLGLAPVTGCLGSEQDDAQVPSDPDQGIRGGKPQRSPSPPEELERCGPGTTRGLVPAWDWRIEHVHAYQGVEVPLIRDGRPIEQRGIDLVQGRDLLVRVFVAPMVRRSSSGRERRAHLIVGTEGEDPVVYEDVRILRGPSRRDRMESTFNFFVPGEELFGNQSLAVELWDVGFCPSSSQAAPNRVPEVEDLPLAARATGPVRVRIVPIRFEADGSNRLPDVTAGHMDELASLLAAVFPVSHVELSLREPVGTTQSDLVDILNQLLQLRALENPPNNVSYYGMVEPAASMVDYCRFGCVAGVATFGPASGSGAVGVGIGYRGVADDTFVHEMGHVYRLMHAPCGGPSGTDPQFPYPNGALGSWGYDARSGELIDPGGDRRDFMSYCDPSWISDYNYRALLDRLSIVNGMHATDRSEDAADWTRYGRGGSAPWPGASMGSRGATPWWLKATPFSTQWAVPREVLADELEEAFAASRPDEVPEDASAAWRDNELLVFRTLRLDAAGVGRWGVPIVARADPGERVTARMLDVDGAVVAWADVYRRDLSEDQGTFFFVPQPEVGWAAVAIEGWAPQPFSASPDVAAFVP